MENALNTNRQREKVPVKLQHFFRRVSINSLVRVHRPPLFEIEKPDNCEGREQHYPNATAYYTDNRARTFLESFKRGAFKTLRVSFKTNFLS